MAANPVVLYSGFEPSALRFGAVERNRKGGKQVNLYNGTPGAASQIMIQTPPCHLPFGISDYNNKDTGKVESYQMSMSFRGADTDARVATFQAKMAALDNLIMETAATNSEAWFGKKLSRDALEMMYRPLIKPSNDDRYASTLNTKIPVSGGEPQVVLFDVDNNPISVDAVPKGAVVRAILKVGNLWFIAGGMFGVTLYVTQARVVSLPAGAPVLQPAFLEDEADAMAA